MRVLFSVCCLWLALAAPASAQDAQSRLAHLKQALHLTAQQMEAWNTYQSAMAPDPGVQAREASAHRMLPGLPTPRRLSLIEASMEDRLDDFRKRSARIEDFYGQLTPDQQRIFDQETAPPATRGPGD